MAAIYNVLYWPEQTLSETIRLGRRNVVTLLPWDILPLLGVVLVKQVVSYSRGRFIFGSFWWCYITLL